MSKKKYQTFGCVSLGCAKNRVDSERIMGFLREGGLTITSNPEEADVLLVNTCGFIQPAKEESIEAILDMAEYKKKKCKKLLVSGCLAQRYLDELKKQLPEVDRFIPIDEYNHLPEILQEELELNHLYPDPTRFLSTDSWMGYLKISDGCYNVCSYCAIPLIKGKYTSEPMEVLLKEAKDLAKAGVKELVLVAQDTTMYGVDLYGKKRLLDLLEELNQIDGFQWIRVLYLYPSQLDETMIQGLKKIDKFVPYFDLPMQYGNDRMLKLMNRATRISKFKDTVNRIREAFPNAVFRTTMIVGFPEETEEDFRDLLEFVQEMKFDRLGAFAYSREEGTKAYTMDHQVHWKTKQRRLKELLKLQESISQEANQRFVGKTLDVIIESLDPSTGMYVGRSYASAPDDIDGVVLISTSKTHPLGDMVEVHIQSADVYDLFGTEVGEED